MNSASSSKTTFALRCVLAHKPVLRSPLAMKSRRLRCMPLLPLLRERGERVFEMDCNPTAENIARLIYEHARDSGLPVVEVVLWETEHCCSTYAPGT